MTGRAPKPAIGALELLSEELLESYLGDERARRISRRYLPSREAIARDPADACSISCIPDISVAAT